MNKAAMKEILRQIPVLEGALPDHDLTALPPTPHDAFRLWLGDAIAAGVQEPHAMTLSTVDRDGRPDARVLILKNLDARGWHFAIRASSPKGRQIEASPHVALSFHWPALGRQIRLRGPALMLPQEESASDFLDRPLASRASAMASRQSEVLSDGPDFDRKLADAHALLAARPDYVVPDWRVYAVAPVLAEFWQGAADRNHKRLRYRPVGDGKAWRTDRLWP